MFRAWLVAGVVAVTSGWLTTNLRKNCAHVRASNSVAHAGTSRPSTRAPEACAAERRVGEHSDFPLARQWEDGRLDLSVIDGVVDPDEVEWLVSHDAHELRVLPLVGTRDADVADALVLLQLLEHGELRRDIAEVVHLKEVERSLPDAVEGSVDLGPRSGGISGSSRPRDVHLRRPEDPIRDPELARDASGDLLGGAIARGGVEQCSSVLDECTHSHP